MCESPSSTTVQSSPIALERGVHARDLGVPVEHDVVGRAAPDRHPLARRDEVDDHLLVVRVAVDEERRAPALGRDALLEVLRGGDVSVER